MSSEMPPDPVAAAEAGAALPGGRPTRRYVVAALMLMMALAAMEQTVTATVLPTIIGELHGLEYYAWVPAIYLLAATVSMPFYGRLADAAGRKRVMVGAILLFTLGSILAAFSQSMLQLTLFRAIQGLGAGGIMPVVLTILGDLFTIEERARIQGLFSAIWGTSSLAGPALGAALVHTLGWRSIFWVNLPFGLLGLAVLAVAYHDREKPHGQDLDVPGSLMLAVGSAALLVGVSLVGMPGRAPALGGEIPAAAAGAVLLAGAGAILALFLRYERRAAHPIMPPGLIFRAPVGPAVLASLIMGVGIFSLDTYVPLYVQGGRGGGAAAAAATVTPVMLCWALSSFLAAPLLVRWGFRRTALLGSSLIVASFLGLVICVLTGAAPLVLTAVLAVAGMGFGPTSMSYLLCAQDAVAWQQRGIATSSITFARTYGGALGVAVLGALLNVLIQPGLAQLEAHGVKAAELLDPRGHVQLAGADRALAQQIIGSGLLWVFLLMLAFAAGQWTISRWIPRQKSSHRVSRTEGFESGV